MCRFSAMDTVFSDTANGADNTDGLCVLSFGTVASTNGTSATTPGAAVWLEWHINESSRHPIRLILRSPLAYCHTQSSLMLRLWWHCFLCCGLPRVDTSPLLTEPPHCETAASDEVSEFLYPNICSAVLVPAVNIPGHLWGYLLIISRFGN